MELTLVRDKLLSTATTGILDVDGIMECYICEDAVRPAGVKIPGQTAIPYGRYKVIITESQRFNRRLPLLLNVLNFTGIRIHPGNTAANTDGCLLTGTSRNAEAGTVSQSVLAFDKLFAKLDEALKTEEVWITIQEAA